MPKQTQGFNDKGESQWFNGSRPPEGWSITDPTLVKQEEPEKPEGEPELKVIWSEDDEKPGEDSEIKLEVTPETVPDTPDVARTPVKRKSRSRTRS